MCGLALANIDCVRTFNTFRPLIYSLVLWALLTQPASAEPTDGSWRTVDGRAFYEKIDVTDSGLDLSHPVIVPIRNARVEVIDPVTNGILSVSQTAQAGRFEVIAPAQ